MSSRIHDLWTQYEAAGLHESQAWRFRADRLLMLLTEFQEAHGKAQGARLFVSERRERGVSDTTAHRMMSVAKTLPSSETDDLPVEMQYRLAKAVMQEKGELADLLDLARTLSVSDFTDEVFGEKEHKQRSLRCPTCGYEGSSEEFSGSRKGS